MEAGRHTFRHSACLPASLKTSAYARWLLPIQARYATARGTNGTQALGMHDSSWMSVSADDAPCKRACLSPTSPVAENSAYQNEAPVCPLTRVCTKECVVLLISILKKITLTLELALVDSVVLVVLFDALVLLVETLSSSEQLSLRPLLCAFVLGYR